MSMFDIIGPVMIGPSSSHTAGAARIGPLPPVFSVSQRMMSACAVLLRSRRNDM